MLNWLLNKLQKRAQTLSDRQYGQNGSSASPDQIDALIREGYQYHTAGELDRAEAAYRKILFRDPKHADALYLLGEIQQAKGRPDEAIPLISRAIEASPGISAFHVSLAELQRQTHDLAAAETSYREAIRLDETNVECINNLGTLYLEQGRHDDALACFERALKINPDLPQALFNTAVIYRQRGRNDEAAALLERAAAQQPDSSKVQLELAETCLVLGKKEQALACYKKAFSDASTLNVPEERAIEAHFECGNILLEQQQTDAAITEFLRALDVNRGIFSTWVNLGNAYREAKQFDAAINSYLEAIRLNPSCAQAFGNLGISLKEMGNCTRAREVYQAARQSLPEASWPDIDPDDPYCELDVAMHLNQRAITVDPKVSDFNLNLGVIFEEKGQFTKALECYEQTLATNPELSFAHFNKGIALLRLGQFDAGWDEYEARMKLGKNINLATLDAAPLWQGQPLSDSILLVHAEQGLGDTLQFIRYLKAVKEKCRRVIFECQPAVKSLIESMPDMKNVYAAGSPLPRFDYQVPLLSLPRIFGTRPDTIPTDIPYIFADPQRAETWKQKTAGCAGLKVGIVWAGGAVHAGNRFRSCSLAVFAPLAGAAGVTFISLQKGEPEQEAKTPPAGMNLLNFSDQILDFRDTAALMDNLDLVITVDTSVAHLAGAMGKPVWVLIPFCPDWRWMLDRTDSPWYPSMRLFRQTAIGEWTAAIGQIKNELTALSKAHQAAH